MPDDIKRVISENVKALLRTEAAARGDGREPGVARLIDKGLTNGNAQRVLKGETSIGVDLLAQLAQAFQVHPWQLMVPGLDPARLPGLTEDATAWPFPLVDRSQYRALSATDRAWVQGVLANAIRERKSSDARPVADAPSLLDELRAEWDKLPEAFEPVNVTPIPARPPRASRRVSQLGGKTIGAIAPRDEHQQSSRRKKN